MRWINQVSHFMGDPRFYISLVVLLLIAFVWLAWNHDANVRIENERTGEIVYALGGRVKMIRLSDGTRCVVYERSLGAAIDCDWAGGEE